MVQKSQTTWDVIKNPVNIGINYQPQLVNVGFLPINSIIQWCIPILSSHSSLSTTNASRSTSAAATFEILEIFGEPAIFTWRSSSGWEAGKKPGLVKVGPWDPWDPTTNSSHLTNYAIPNLGVESSSFHPSSFLANRKRGEEQKLGLLRWLLRPYWGILKGQWWWS